MTLPADLADRLSNAQLDPRWVEDLVRAAIEEDLAGGVDVTSAATLPEGQRATADIASRAHGVVAGLPIVEVALAVATNGDVEIVRPVEDGAFIEPGDVVLTATAATQDLLLAERVALNFLCHLSGVATTTRRWADAVRGSGAAIRDTRKTTPLLRSLEKYAVRCGGGLNHRLALSDAALVKDNHVAAAGSVAEAFRRVREKYPDLPVEVEVDTVDAAVEAVEAGAELILLDNFSLDELRQAVDKVAGRARLEASGGLTLARARDVAATGVDYLAVGALTHSAPALDLSLDIREVRA